MSGTIANYKILPIAQLVMLVDSGGGRLKVKVWQEKRKKIKHIKLAETQGRKRIKYIK